MKWQYLQLEKWLQKGYNPYCLRETKSEKEVPRCSSFLAIPIATLLAAPSGRFSAGFAASAANRIYAALRLAGPFYNAAYVQTASVTMQKPKPFNQLAKGLGLLLNGLL